MKTSICRIFALAGILTLGLLAYLLIWAAGSGSALAANALPAAAPPQPVAELHVCPSGCTYSSVQSAVDAARTDDLIKVAGGTYTDIHAREGITQVVYISKTVTIQGGYTPSDWDNSDPAAHPTTLDAGGQGRVLYITGDIHTTIQGLFLTGGDAAGLGGDDPSGYDAGGAIYILGSAPTLKDNQVFDNKAERGGGFYLSQDSATLSKNNVFANRATLNGGGLFLIGSDAVLSDNTISANTSDSYGGGLCLMGGYPTLTGNFVTDNQAHGAYSHGGGLYLITSEATLDANTIISNTTDAWGGGLLLFDSAATLTGNIITGNVAEQGGGLFLDASNAMLINTVVADNRTRSSGSGIQIRRSPSLRLLHTTLARNSGGDGTGVYVTNLSSDYSSVAMTNTIIIDHLTGIAVETGNAASLDTTLWYANPTNWTGAVAHTGDYTGNPAFDTDGYHLTSASAAVDRGVDAGVELDVDGDPRPGGTAPDLGADELWRWSIQLPLVLRNH